MTPEYKATRARSEEKKALQFERILDAGKELLLKKGPQGFSMRNLAEMLGMTKNNLYNYIESKRELWMAIRNRFYTQFKAENLEIIKSHKDSKCDLIIKLYEHFLDFADEDYDKFKMMFNIIDAPPSSKVGPIEETYKDYRLLEGTTEIIQEAIDEGEITTNSAALLSLFTYSVVMGVAYIQMVRSKEYGTPKPVWETIQSQLDVPNEDFKKYTLKVLEYLLKDGAL